MLTIELEVATEETEVSLDQISEAETNSTEEPDESENNN